MHITLRQLEVYRAVALTGSTTAAAREVSLSQSATSAALSEFERNLHTRLFDRIGKRLLLNDKGRALLPAVLAVLDGASSVETAFRSGAVGVMVDFRLYASTTVGNYLLPAVLSSYRKLAPAARLDVRIGNTLEVVGAVQSFAADLGFIEGPCHADDVTLLPWFEDELVIVGAPGHALTAASSRRRLTMQQLTRAPWLLREPGSGTREAVELALAPHFKIAAPSMTLGSSEAIKNSVAAGMGVACLSRSVVQNLLAVNKLVVLPTTLPRLSRRIALIHHEKKLLSDSLRRFVAHCRDQDHGER